MMIAGIIGVGAGIRRPDPRCKCHVRFTGELIKDLVGNSISSSGVSLVKTPALFVGGSLYSTGGSSKYAIVADSSAFDLTTVNFTAEITYQRYASTSEGYVFNRTDNPVSTNYDVFGFRINGAATGKIYFYTTAARHIDIAIPQDTLKHHLCITRSGSTLTAYVDGVSKGTSNVASESAANSSDGIVFLSEHVNNAYANGLAGYVSEFRLTVGIALPQSQWMLTRRK